MHVVQRLSVRLGLGHKSLKSESLWVILGFGSFLVANDDVYGLGLMGLFSLVTVTLALASARRRGNNGMSSGMPRVSASRAIA